MDTGVLRAACGSGQGVSRFVCLKGGRQGRTLITSGYCVQETLRNLVKLRPEASGGWTSLIEPQFQLVPDAIATGKRVLVFTKAKDRPMVIAALVAEATALLTLDRTDFQSALGPQVCRMVLRSPADFLVEQRQAGLICRK